MTHEGVRYLIIRVPGNVSFGMPLDMSLINTIPSLYHTCASIHGEMEFDEVLMIWYRHYLRMCRLLHIHI